MDHLLSADLVDRLRKVGLTLELSELREWRRRRAEVYVPLVHRPAESAQADFLEVAVELAGERRWVWLLLFRLMHSGRDFVRLYERHDKRTGRERPRRALQNIIWFRRSIGALAKCGDIHLKSDG